jgi:hypothetical protein
MQRGGKVRNPQIVQKWLCSSYKRPLGSLNLIPVVRLGRARYGYTERQSMVDTESQDRRRS